MPQSPQPTRSERTLPPLAWALMLSAGLLLVLMVAGIAVQIAILQDSRDHIRAQDAKTAVLLAKVRSASPAAGDAAALVRQAGPLVRTVRRSLGPARAAGASLVSSVADLPMLVRTAQALASAALPLLAQVRGEDLIALAARAARSAPDLVGLQRRLLRVQLTTLRSQRRSLAVQLETLRIQRAALAHIKSIDRKTGGSVPSTPPALP